MMALAGSGFPLRDTSAPPAPQCRDVLRCLEPLRQCGEHGGVRPPSACLEQQLSAGSWQSPLSPRVLTRGAPGVLGCLCCELRACPGFAGCGPH